MLATHDRTDKPPSPAKGGYWRVLPRSAPALEARANAGLAGTAPLMARLPALQAKATSECPQHPWGWGQAHSKQSARQVPAFAQGVRIYPLVANNAEIFDRNGHRFAEQPHGPTAVASNQLGRRFSLPEASQSRRRAARGILRRS